MNTNEKLINLMKKLAECWRVRQAVIARDPIESSLAREMDQHATRLEKKAKDWEAQPL